MNSSLDYDFTWRQWSKSLNGHEMRCYFDMQAYKSHDYMGRTAVDISSEICSYV